jgi:ATP-dependent helicase/nuclease subunit B
MTSTLLTGSQYVHLERAAFERAAEIAEGSLGSVLYITRNDAGRSEVEDNWATTHDPLCLRAETLDAVVRGGAKTVKVRSNHSPGN